MNKLHTRHQSHVIVNRNRRIRESVVVPNQPTLTTSGSENDNDIYHLDGRLKVSTYRDYSWTVPVNHDMMDVVHKNNFNPRNQVGALVEQEVPVCTSNDYNSFIAAFNKRCNFRQAKENDDIDDRSYIEALQLIESLPSTFTQWEENEADRERWLAKFDIGKRTRMEAAYHTIPEQSGASLAVKDLMVKQEVLIKRNDPDWAPRIVYVGTDAFNAVTGPANMVLMERMVDFTRHNLINGIKFKYAYKTSDVELADFISTDEFPNLVEGDFSRNDREQRSRVVLLFNAWCEKLGMPAWFSDLNLTLNNFKVISRQYKFTAWIQNQLPTGTTSTTTRNSFYNTIMFAVICGRQKIVGRALVLGDDILAALKRRLNLQTWVKEVADFKMVLKAKAPALNGDATFLSRRFIIDDVETPFMLPLLGKMLIRYNARGTNNMECSPSQYCAGKALSYAYECRHVPCLRDVFMARYEMEDEKDKVTLDDLTWFARSSNVSFDNIRRFILDEEVVIDDFEFSCWTMQQYGLDYLEVLDMFKAIVLQPDMVLVDLPNIEKMKCDY